MFSFLPTTLMLDHLYYMCGTSTCTCTHKKYCTYFITLICSQYSSHEDLSITPLYSRGQPTVLLCQQFSWNHGYCVIHTEPHYKIAWSYNRVCTSINTETQYIHACKSNLCSLHDKACTYWLTCRQLNCLSHSITVNHSLTSHWGPLHLVSHPLLVL